MGYRNNATVSGPADTGWGDVENRRQKLYDDMAVITLLIEEWRASNDPELEWVIHVLEYLLERSRGELTRLTH